METTRLPDNIIRWFESRGITSDVLARAHIEFKNDKIVIPVYDRTGRRVFAKYRRNPAGGDDGSPKYTYEKGSTATLYVPPFFDRHTTDTIFICEGELDCLRLASVGAFAVSSTGGAGTFKSEWVSFFNAKETYVCYDNDEAGIKGAFKVQELIPHAKLIWLGRFEGKDVTDYLAEHPVSDFLSLVGQAHQYQIPNDLYGPPTSKKELTDKKRQFAAALELAHEDKRRELSRRNGYIEPHLILIELLRRRYENYANLEESWGRRTGATEEGATDIAAAKEVPISLFVRFTAQGFAKCIWHEDSTPSMKLNGPNSKYPNTVKCFGCGHMGDVIDVIMHLQNLDMKAATRFLLNK